MVFLSKPLLVHEAPFFLVLSIMPYLILVPSLSVALVI